MKRSDLRRKLRGVKPLDLLAVVIALGVFGASVAFTVERSSGPPVVDIQGQHRQWMYPLSTNRTVDVPGPLGITRVVIDGGSAYIQDSPCKQKIGIHMGHISTEGSWVACLPNRVFVRIEGSPRKEVDRVAY